jgi:hypothetical protein
VRAFAPLFRRFYFTPFTQTTHADNRHLFIDQKVTPPKEKPKKTEISKSCSARELPFTSINKFLQITHFKLARYRVLCLNGVREC